MAADPKSASRPDTADDVDATPAITTTKAEDLFDRRRQVLSLRGRRMSVHKIAEAMNIAAETVCKDLDWIRKRGAEMFGTHPEFDPNAFVWESLCRFDDIETTALRDSMTKGIPLRDKMLCLSEAREARTSMISLLMDTGQLQRAPINVNVNLPTAAQIRQAIADAATADEDVIDVTPPKKRLPSANGNGAGG